MVREAIQRAKEAGMTTARWRMPDISAEPMSEAKPPPTDTGARRRAPGIPEPPGDLASRRGLGASRMYAAWAPARNPLSHNMPGA